jgi:hypothetical protein
MQREITITLDEQIYQGLYRVVGPEHISQFIESLLRPHVIGVDLESAYRQMAEDQDRESEAFDWAEATVGDIADETK